MRTNALKNREFECFVLGFLFGPAYGGAEEVLLIRKRRPRWMRGKLNGIGGKLEEGECPKEGMQREMREETGLEWKLQGPFVQGPIVQGPFAILNFARLKRRVYCFTSNKKYMRSATTMTDEHVDRYGYPQCLQCKDLADHLRWLLPLAVEHNRKSLKGLVEFNLD